MFEDIDFESIKRHKKRLKKIVTESSYYKKLAQYSYKNSRQYCNYEDALISLAGIQLELNEPEKLYSTSFYESSHNTRKDLNDLLRFIGLGNELILRPYWLQTELVKAFVATHPPSDLYLKTKEMAGLMFFPLSCAPRLELGDRSEIIKWVFWKLTEQRLYVVCETEIETLFHSIDRISIQDISKDSKSNTYLSLNPEEKINDEQKDEYYENRVKLISLAAQTLLYVENYQPELLPDSCKHLKGRKGLNGKRLSCQGLIVGENYKAKKAVSDRQTTNQSPSSVITHWRSGHWRNQPYGSKDNIQHKTIWIQPMLINADSIINT